MRCRNSVASKVCVALIFILVGLYSNAQGFDRPPDIFERLDAKTVIEVIEPLKIDGNITTPFAVRYTKNGDMAPSCALVDAVNSTRSLEMIGPSDGQFANCHRRLSAPVITKIGGHYFAAYTYVVEDPRAVFETSYQVVRLGDHGYWKCRADERISLLVAKLSAEGVALNNAVGAAIRKFGCANAIFN